MMTIRTSLAALALGCGSAVTAQAASIYLTPSSQMVPIGTTTASFELMMNFSAGESTIGGGIDIGVSGAGSFFGFTPSTYLTTVPDAAFTGFGTARADRDYEVHFGSFTGLSGINNLGTLTLRLTGVPGGVTTVSLATNQFWGGFFSATSGAPLNAVMTGGSVGNVPEPQAALLLLAGLGVVSTVTRRRLSAA